MEIIEHGLLAIEEVAEEEEEKEEEKANRAEQGTYTGTVLLHETKDE